jgi:hypothetical protein
MSAPSREAMERDARIYASTGGGIVVTRQPYGMGVFRSQTGGAWEPR